MPPATPPSKPPTAKKTLEVRRPPTPTPPAPTSPHPPFIPIPTTFHTPLASTRLRRRCPCRLCAAVTIHRPLTNSEILAIREKIADYEKRRRNALGFCYRRVKMLSSDWKRYMMQLAEGLDEKGQEYNERLFLIVVEQASEKWERSKELGRRKEELERRLSGVTLRGE